MLVLKFTPFELAGYSTAEKSLNRFWPIKQICWIETREIVGQPYRDRYFPSWSKRVLSAQAMFTKNNFVNTSPNEGSEYIFLIEGTQIRPEQG